MNLPDWIMGKEKLPAFNSVGTLANPAETGLEPDLDEGVPVSGEIICHSDPDGLTMWNGKKAIMLLPVYRSFHPDTHFTLFANYAKYGPEKIGMIQHKRTCIWEARNILVHKWMKTDSPYGIMCDDDMIFPCGNADLFNERYGAGVSNESASFNMISRLMSHGEDKKVVGGLYFGRHKEGQAQCAMGFGDARKNAQLHRGEIKGVVKDGWVGTGALRIHRDAILRLKEAIDGGKWPELAPVGPDGWYGYFNPLGVRIGEDVSFGRRLEEVGVQSWLDADLVCLHVGDVPFGPKNTQ